MSLPTDSADPILLLALAAKFEPYRSEMAPAFARITWGRIVDAMREAVETNREFRATAAAHWAEQFELFLEERER